MENKLSTLFNVTNRILPIDGEPIADVSVSVIDSVAKFIVELKNDTELDSMKTFELLAPFMANHFCINIDELNNTFSVLKPKCFTFNFNYKPTRDSEESIIASAKTVLAYYKIFESNLKSIEYYPGEHSKGKGMVIVKVNIGYDASDDIEQMERHRKFLKQMLERMLLMRVKVHLT